MILADTESSSGLTTIRLRGELDEASALEPVLGSLVSASGPVRIVAREIIRANSAGAKHWMRFFGAVGAKRVELVFAEVSTALVDLANLIPNFFAGGKIESVCAPFLCLNCGLDQLAVFSAAEIQRQGASPPDLECARCQAPAVFDDSPRTYFGFLGSAR